MTAPTVYPTHKFCCCEDQPSNSDSDWTIATTTYDNKENACTSCGGSSVYSFDFNGSTYWTCTSSVSFLYDSTTPDECHWYSIGPIFSNVQGEIQSSYLDEEFVEHLCRTVQLIAPFVDPVSAVCDCCPDDPSNDDSYWTMSGGYATKSEACDNCILIGNDPVYQATTGANSRWFCSNTPEDLRLSYYWEDSVNSCIWESETPVVQGGDSTVESHAPGSSIICRTLSFAAPTANFTPAYCCCETDPLDSSSYWTPQGGYSTHEGACAVCSDPQKLDGYEKWYCDTNIFWAYSYDDGTCTWATTASVPSTTETDVQSTVNGGGICRTFPLTSPTPSWAAAPCGVCAFDWHYYRMCSTGDEGVTQNGSHCLETCTETGWDCQWTVETNEWHCYRRTCGTEACGTDPDCATWPSDPDYPNSGSVVCPTCIFSWLCTYDCVSGTWGSVLENYSDCLDEGDCTASAHGWQFEFQDGDSCVYSYASCSGTCGTFDDCSSQWPASPSAPTGTPSDCPCSSPSEYYCVTIWVGPGDPCNNPGDRLASMSACFGADEFDTNPPSAGSCVPSLPAWVESVDCGPFDNCDGNCPCPEPTDVCYATMTWQYFTFSPGWVQALVQPSTTCAPDGSITEGWSDCTWEDPMCAISYTVKGPACTVPADCASWANALSWTAPTATCPCEPTYDCYGYRVWLASNSCPDGWYLTGEIFTEVGESPYEEGWNFYQEDPNYCHAIYSTNLAINLGEDYEDCQTALGFAGTYEDPPFDGLQECDCNCSGCASTYSAMISGITPDSTACTIGPYSPWCSDMNSGTPISFAASGTCTWDATNFPLYYATITFSGNDWLITLETCGSGGPTMIFTKPGDSCPAGSYTRTGGTSPCSGGTIALS